MKVDLKLVKTTLGYHYSLTKQELGVKRFPERIEVTGTGGSLLGNGYPFAKLKTEGDYAFYRQQFGICTLTVTDETA